MNKLLSVFFFFFFSGAVSAQINFQTATVDKVKNSSISGFVYLTGTWCVSCQVMEETTFESQVVQNALSGKYNAYKIDIDTKEGQKWAAEFEICCLPTMLFFDEKGNQIQKIQSPLTSTALSKILNNPTYNSKPASVKIPVYENSEYNEGTIVMEEVSFSEAYPNSKASVVSENQPPTLATEQIFTKEIIDYSEKRNDATSEQKKGEFLYHLDVHIKSLEAHYIEHAISDRGQISDIISKVKTPATDEEIPVSSTEKIENGQLIKDTETLYELIQELKDWEERLRNTDYEIRSMFVAGESTIELESSTESPAEADNAFRLQMGYFKNEKYAKRLAKDLKTNYDYSIELKVDNQPEGMFHRVLLGSFKSEKEAAKIARKLKKEGRNAILKKG